MKIAITGTIGSGKSTFSKLLTKSGYPVFNVDKYNSYLLENDPIVFTKITKQFDCLTDDDNIDKKKLADIIFNDDQRKQELEEILHPLILKKIIDESELSKIFIAEVPILFESNMHSYFDLIILVKTDLEIVKKRLLSRGLSSEQIRLRISKQFPVETKEKLSDIIVSNNGDLNDLQLEVERIIEIIEGKL